MSEKLKKLAAAVEERFGDTLTRLPSRNSELAFEVPVEKIREVMTALRDEEPFSFEQVMDICGIDYLTYGQGEWQTDDATDTGFSRGVARELPKVEPNYDRRFAVVYQLLSVSKNHRLRLKAFCGPEEVPVVPSVVDIWNGANWFEREAFDMFGILFEGHPDMRRILTDYGFVGYPFRKDFPLSGHVEVRYDTEKGRVVYQPVSIEPRTLVPKVIRKDHRYMSNLKYQDDHKNAQEKN
ncbi:MAG: NADH-quinone oxidoreductase subunit C [Gammaproteobacteria bacterium]|nr:NADH-quinone oxidoreductase subunit C [Gammaproteobacteria bacterium]